MAKPYTRILDYGSMKPSDLIFPNVLTRGTLSIIVMNGFVASAPKYTNVPRVEPKIVNAIIFFAL